MLKPKLLTVVIYSLRAALDLDASAKGPHIVARLRPRRSREGSAGTKKSTAAHFDPTSAVSAVDAVFPIQDVNIRLTSSRSGVA